MSSIRSDYNWQKPTPHPLKRVELLPTLNYNEVVDFIERKYGIQTRGYKYNGTVPPKYFSCGENRQCLL